MLQITIQSNFAGIFTIILILWALLLFGGLIFGKMTPESEQKMPRWARLTSSFILVIAAWVWIAPTRNLPVSQIAIWFAGGMTLGFIGDLFMARIITQENHILGGIGAFAACHITYIAGILSLSKYTNAILLRWDILAIWWAIGLAGWFAFVFYRNTRSILHYAALPYSLLLTSTAGFATSLYLADHTGILIAAGAVLFLLSDLILAAALFRDIQSKSIHDIVWILYGPGQMLIVCGLFLMNVT